MPWLILALIGGGVWWALSKQPQGEAGAPAGYAWPPADGSHMPRNCWLSTTGLVLASLMLMRLGYLHADFDPSQYRITPYDGPTQDPVLNALVRLANDYGFAAAPGDFGSSMPNYDSVDSIAYNLLSDVYAVQFGTAPVRDIYYQHNPNPAPPNPPCPNGSWP